MTLMMMMMIFFSLSLQMAHSVARVTAPMVANFQRTTGDKTIAELTGGMFLKGKFCCLTLTFPQR
jgi:hypothetical protein